MNRIELRRIILETLNEYVNLDLDTLNELGMMLEVEILKWVADKHLRNVASGVLE